MNIKLSCFLILLICLYSCNDDKKNAQKLLENARLALEKKEFTSAINILDSLNLKYPRAFDERKQSILLLDSIRKNQNIFTLEYLSSKKDSLNDEIGKLKKNFTYSRDTKYQESGIYTINGQDNTVRSTTLDVGINESGEMFLKSVYNGNQTHNIIKAYCGGASSESLPITSDGYVHRFSNLGQTYEIIYVHNKDNNGLFDFLYKNADQKIKIELIGKNKYTYELSNKIKNNIKETYDLSLTMLYLDSIQMEMEKLQYKNFYLDHQRNSSIPKDSITLE